MLVAERQTSTALCLLAISRLGCLLTFFSFCFVTVTDTMQTEQKSLKGVAAATLLERSSAGVFWVHTCACARERGGFYRVTHQVAGQQSALFPFHVSDPTASLV